MDGSTQKRFLVGLAISIVATPVFGGSYFGYYASSRDGAGLTRSVLYASIIGFVFGIPFAIGLFLLYLELPVGYRGQVDAAWLLRLPRAFGTALVYWAALGGIGGAIGSAYARFTRP